MHAIGHRGLVHSLSSRSRIACVLVAAAALPGACVLHGQTKTAANTEAPKIITLDPPELGFYSKALYFHGIPIKSHAVVSNEALYAAYGRLSLLLTNLLPKQPMVISNLV